MPELIDLHQINGLYIGYVLQTNEACGNIIDHITLKMRKKLCSEIVVNKSKLCIIVDESTTISYKTMLVICLRVAIVSNEEVITFF